MKKHIIAALRNFVIIFSGIWTFLESSSAFGWITITSFGIWGYLNMCLISLLLSFITTYIEFYYRGKDEKIKEVIEKKFPEIIDFKGAYRFTNWNQLIGAATNEVVICGYYFDTWITWVSEELKVFLNKQDSKLKIIVSKPSDQRRLSEIARLFPQYSEEMVKNKIISTKNKFLKLVKEQQLSTDKIEYYQYRNSLNYSYILIDKRFLFITIYENERFEKADGFSIVLDIDLNSDLKKFIFKEYKLMIQNSEQL